MVMLKPPGKASKIAKQVMKNKGVKQPKPMQSQQKPLETPYLQH